MGSSARDKAPCLLWLLGLHSVLPQTTRQHPCKVSPTTDLGRGTEHSREVSDTAVKGKSCLDYSYLYKHARSEQLKDSSQMG